MANIALQNMGKEKGDYASINPNDHVNLVRGRSKGGLKGARGLLEFLYTAWASADSRQ